MNVIGWRAWYVDGSVYTPDDDLPADGCLGFVMYYDEWAAPGVHYRDVVTGGDWYVVGTGGRIQRHGSRADGTWADPPVTVAGEVLVRSARMLPEGDWERVQHTMMEARSWP